MSAVLSAPLSAKKPIEVIYAEINELSDILRETRQTLGVLRAVEACPDRVTNLIELKTREQNSLLLLSGLRRALAYEIDREDA